MKRVVFDCNIFLQALARPQSPAGICFQLAEQGIIHIYISDEIMTEIGDVLRRPVIQTRFPQLTETVIGAFLEHIRRIGLYYSAIPHHVSYLRDVDDEPYLNLAISVNADFLVSRDNDLLGLMTSYDDVSSAFRRQWYWLKIVDPLTFLHTFDQEVNSKR